MSLNFVRNAKKFLKSSNRRYLTAEEKIEFKKGFVKRRFLINLFLIATFAFASAFSIIFIGMGIFESF